MSLNERGQTGLSPVPTQWVTDRRLKLVSYSGMGQPIAVTAEWRKALDGYISWLAAANRPEGTLGLRSYQLRRFATTTGLGPFSATTDDLIDYMGQHDWSANTRRSTRSTIRSYFRWALLQGHVTVNPAENLPGVKAMIGKPRPAPEPAIEVGLRTSDRRVRLMVALAAWAGLRCCEIAVVHHRDLIRDYQGWELRVHGKGSKLRVVPIPEPIARSIQDADGYVFPGQKNGHLSAAYVSKMVSRALPDEWTAHTLRHRFASVAYLADRDIRAVQELLGHSSVATTQIYTAVPTDNLRRAVQAASGRDTRVWFDGQRTCMEQAS